MHISTDVTHTYLAEWLPALYGNIWCLSASPRLPPTMPPHASIPPTPYLPQHWCAAQSSRHFSRSRSQVEVKSSKWAAGTQKWMLVKIFAKSFVRFFLHVSWHARHFTWMRVIWLDDFDGRPIGQFSTNETCAAFYKQPNLQPGFQTVVCSTLIARRCLRFPGCTRVCLGVCVCVWVCLRLDHYAAYGTGEGGGGIVGWGRGWKKVRQKDEEEEEEESAIPSYDQEMFSSRPFHLPPLDRCVFIVTSKWPSSPYFLHQPTKRWSCYCSDSNNRHMEPFSANNNCSK